MNGDPLTATAVRICSTTMLRGALVSSAVSLLMSVLPGSVNAQASPTRTVVATADVSVPGREAILSVSILGEGTVVARHIHPGDEIGFVVEGELRLVIDGQPERIVKAGEGYIVPGGVVHSATVAGSKPVRIVVTHVVEKGRPLRIPAP